MRIFSFLLQKSELSPFVSIAGDGIDCTTSLSRVFNPVAIMRPREPAIDIVPDTSVPLIQLAWARSGDKGNLFNVGVFAREEHYYPYIAAALAADAVGEWFAHLLDDPLHPKIERFLLPGAMGLNFVVHESLGGGGSLCARIDPIAKSMAQILLEFPIAVPRAFA